MTTLTERKRKSEITIDITNLDLKKNLSAKFLQIVDERLKIGLQFDGKSKINNEIGGDDYETSGKYDERIIGKSNKTGKITGIEAAKIRKNSTVKKSKVGKNTGRQNLTAKITEQIKLSEKIKTAADQVSDKNPQKLCTKALQTIQSQTEEMHKSKKSMKLTVQKSSETSQKILTVLPSPEKSCKSQKFQTVQSEATADNVKANLCVKEKTPESVTSVISIWNCSTCLTSFPSWMDLRLHKLEHSQTFRCKNCFRPFHRVLDLKKHQKSCWTDWTCGHCRQSFERESFLRQHMKRRHTKNKSVPDDLDYWDYYDYN